MKILHYYPELDAFHCTTEFTWIAETLGIAEWTPVVWLGRLLARDQDFGEHWADRWPEREALQDKYKTFEFLPDEDWSTLLIVVPDAFTQKEKWCWSCQKEFQRLPCPNCGKEVHVGTDGPCHTDEAKKLFWTDLLKSLDVSLETLFAIARSTTQKLPDLEERIEKVKAKYEGLQAGSGIARLSN